ncbi:hypothetical protein PPL_06325 [Heterostelium album PN500]|uniref:Glycoside hydrolase family 5 domain-containing protein n=1 Tax=Heterostelium pallidum (strain ATCC 26659 / Pp 5 / PN500) TaxID=670386 RepID=D3BCU7_HETP5|nr:hypothetical protein PPL_06325 [Heterostelium album PN500]EFA80739.1 hypothetical protein PPL_06325 [Heterostelium album PN500]|eukprot:XP_020432859.1 hypothetical protein PPL_06325 [Heterostelium album PN500]
MIKIILFLTLILIFNINDIESLYVKGPFLIDKDKIILLRGISRPSLEWYAFGENLSLNDYKLMKGWGANVVRLSLNQDFWLEKAKLYNKEYKETVAKQVKMIRSLGMYCILDLHWSDDGDINTEQAGQKRMADENSIEFWKQVAPIYKNDTGVLFELYNEPLLLPWRVWKEGGVYNGKKYIGMQQLYDAVRNQSAENIVIINGIRWGFDLYGAKDLVFPGYNIMFGTHPYKDPTRVKKYWDQTFGDLSDKYPIIATEFGEFTCDTNYTKEFLDYADMKEIHWSAWGWYKKDCAFPSVIAEWDGTPSAVGELVKESLTRTIKEININFLDIEDKDKDNEKEKEKEEEEEGKEAKEKEKENEKDTDHHRHHNTSKENVTPLKSAEDEERDFIDDFETIDEEKDDDMSVGSSEIGAIVSAAIDVENNKT